MACGRNRRGAVGAGIGISLAEGIEVGRNKQAAASMVLEAALNSKS